MNKNKLPPVPVETAGAAQAVFGSRNFYLATGDRADQLLSGIPVETGDRPALAGETPARLYLITIFQYLETLPDLLAVDAHRQRIDWKYALHLPLNAALGPQAADLCAFRRWLRQNPAGQHNLETILGRMAEMPESANTIAADLAADQVILAVCDISRLAAIRITFREALAALAARQPAWLLTHSLPYWYGRYGSHPRDSYQPGDQVEVQARTIGEDGLYLLEAIEESADPVLLQMAEIQALGRIWHEQFEIHSGRLTWRQGACASCP